MVKKEVLMEIVEQKKECCGCHACYNTCPVQAIEMRSDEEGFLYPVILQDKCIQCNRCKNICPVLNKPANMPLQMAYGCYANKKEEQMSSSSGGLFSVLARKVLSENGLVCGAAYDKVQAVYHLIIDSEADLYRLKETKYVQSQIGDAFKTIKNKLEQEKIVLFSGTPCQVAGLRKYLGKEYENLLCIDLICHGVPSPEVWQRYKKEIANGKEIERVSFRNKNQGMSPITIDYYLSDGNVIKESPEVWQRYKKEIANGKEIERVSFRNKNQGMSPITIDYYLSDGNVIKESYADSVYMKGFIQNLYVRPSCFECKFKGTKRCSDLTLGDFWAVKEYYPDFDNGNGKGFIQNLYVRPSCFECKFKGTKRCSDLTLGDFWAVKEYYPDFDNGNGVSAVIVHSEKGRNWIEKIKSDVHILEVTTKEVACWNENLLVPAEMNQNRAEFFLQWNDQNLRELITTFVQNPIQKEKITIHSQLKNWIRKWSR